MDRIIQKMRHDWPLVAEDRRACGDWSETDEAEIGQTIKAVVEAGDADQIAMWARWLADLSAVVLGLRASGVARKMRDVARAQREGGGQ
ncbi:hypothetical protein ACLIIZ_03630 [Azonexus caeni]|jgi:hypothetical protein|uniref:hypothetical protein n=1 Tax=Azonexus caeni TaxID=266126 RepID=UPI003A8B3212